MKMKRLFAVLFFVATFCSAQTYIRLEKSVNDTTSIVYKVEVDSAARGYQKFFSQAIRNSEKPVIVKHDKVYLKGESSHEMVEKTELSFIIYHDYNKRIEFFTENLIKNYQILLFVSCYALLLVIISNIFHLIKGKMVKKYQI